MMNLRTETYNTSTQWIAVARRTALSLVNADGEMIGRIVVPTKQARSGKRSLHNPNTQSAISLTDANSKVI